MRYFCTYFDSGYASRALALYRSLVTHAGPFTLWALCFDDAVHRMLRELALPGVVPIALEEFEDDALRAVKPSRSRVEYYFTCSPSLMLFVLRSNPQIDVLHYVDADLMFFGCPAAIEQELGGGSILIIGHRFSKRNAFRARHGIYNVGLVSFRNDTRAGTCLEWWRERCLEWCYDYLDGDRFADQKYLDRWPEQFGGVVVSQNPGVGVGPWNLDNYPVEMKGGVVHVGGAPLVFFHYHGFRRLWRGLYDPNLGIYGARLTDAIRDGIFLPYVEVLREGERMLAPYGAAVAASAVDRVSARGGRRSAVLHLWRKTFDLMWIGRNLLSRRLFWCPEDASS